MIDNEEKVISELQIVSKSPEILSKYVELATMVQNSMLHGQTGLDALDRLGQVFSSDQRQTLDSLINILCFGTAGKDHSWSDSRFNSCSGEWHKTTSVLIASFLKECKLDCEDVQDRQMMIHWLNKLSFCLFRLSQTAHHSHNASIALVRLFSCGEFFTDCDFANETYFRFIKKYFDECHNSSQLEKVLVLLDIFAKEDERTVLFSFPKLLPDAIDTLAVCAKGLLLSDELYSNPKATLDCLLQIHSVQASLFELLLEHFAKFDMRGLACLTSMKLISHLMEVTKLFSTSSITDDETLFRLPIIKMVVSLCQIAYRFDVEVQTLAPQHRTQVSKMLEGCEFKPTFALLKEWVTRIMHDVLQMGKQLHPTSPRPRVEYLHRCMECLAISMDINTLSLEIQKNGDQLRLYLNVIIPVIVTFAATELSDQTDSSEVVQIEKNLYNPTSCAISLLNKFLTSCGLSHKVAEFLGRVSAHILGKATIDDDQLDKFLGASGTQNLSFSFLVVFNTCARHFSEDTDLSQAIVEFFELHYFDYYAKILATQPQHLMVFRLVYSIQASLQALKQASPNKITELLQHLASIIVQEDDNRLPSYLVELAFDSFRKLIETRDIASKLDHSIYATLDLFDLMKSTNSLRYLSSLSSILRSSIGSRFQKYATKILGLVVYRLEKLTANSPPLLPQVRSQVCREVLRVAESLLSKKGTLENEFCEIESELSKIFMFIRHSESLYIIPEVLSLATSVLQVAGAHIKMLDIVVQSLPAIYADDVNMIVELYDLIYCYIRHDTSFVLEESTSAAPLQLAVHANRNPSQILVEDSPRSASSGLPPFQVINKILLHALKNSRNMSQDPFSRTILLVILQHQRWNEAGLLQQFQEELEVVFGLLQFAETQIDDCCKAGMQTMSSWPESTVMVYTMCSVVILNVFHYYYEDVVQSMLSSNFLQKFLRVGVPMFLEVYSSLPVVFQKIFKVACIRIVNCYKDLKIEVSQMKSLLEIVAKILSVELERSVEQEDELFSKVPKHGRRSKYGSKSTIRFGTSEFERSNRADLICSSFTVIPTINNDDFFIYGIDLYKYFKSTIKEIQQNDPGFTEFVRREMPALTIQQLNDLMMSEMKCKLPEGVPSINQQHLKLPQSQILGFVPRKRAKIVPRFHHNINEERQ